MISASRRNRKEKIWKLNYAPQSSIKPDRLASNAWGSPPIPFGSTQKKMGASLLRNAPNRLKRKSMALETYFAASAAALPAIRPKTMMSV
jgi:hypothetical protein